RHYRTEVRDNGGTVKQRSAAEVTHLAPQVAVWRRNANATWRSDGVNNSDGAKDVNLGAVTPTRFVLGAKGTSGQVVNFRGLVRQFLVFNRYLSDLELRGV